jgi:hypothetical protein
LDRSFRRPESLRAGAREVWRHVLVAVGARTDPWENIAELLARDWETIRRAGPQFLEPRFFLQTGEPDDETAGYRLEDPAVAKAVRAIGSGGGCFGLHASLAAGRDASRLAGERAKLSALCGQEVVANRHHFLALREVRDMGALASAGLTDDYTLGYADVAGFRLGTCRPFPLFDAEAFREVAVTEHPLVVMDCTLVWERYMGLTKAEAIETVRQLAAATKAHRGEFVVLWHNTEWATSPEGDSDQLYPRILAMLEDVV